MQITDMGNSLDVHLNDDDIENLQIGASRLRCLRNMSGGGSLKGMDETIRFLEWIISEATGGVE